MTKLIFKKIYQKVQDYYTYLSEESLSQDKQEAATRNLQRLEFLQEDLYNAEYIKQKPARKKLQYFIDCGFDYQQTADYFQQDLGAVYTFISRYNKLAMDYVGKESLSLILSNNIEEGFQLVGNGKSMAYLNSLVMADIFKLLPSKRKHEDLKVSECMPELSILKLLTFHYLTKQIKARDKNKLEFLVYILMSDDARYNIERGIIYKYLEGSLQSLQDSEKEMNLQELTQYLMDIGV